MAGFLKGWLACNSLLSFFQAEIPLVLPAINTDAVLATGPLLDFTTYTNKDTPDQAETPALYVLLQTVESVIAQPGYAEDIYHFYVKAQVGDTNADDLQDRLRLYIAALSRCIDRHYRGSAPLANGATLLLEAPEAVYSPLFQGQQAAYYQECYFGCFFHQVESQA